VAALLQTGPAARRMDSRAPVNRLDEHRHLIPTPEVIAAAYGKTWTCPDFVPVSFERYYR
jgi:hypothetical protein